MCGGFRQASNTAFIGGLGSLPSRATAVAVVYAVQVLVHVSTVVAPTLTAFKGHYYTLTGV